MKRLWIAIALLCAIPLATLGHAHSLEVFTQALRADLTQAQEAADRNDWDLAENLLDSISDRWEGRGFYLHTMLRHDFLDGIRTELAQAEEFLDHRAAWEFGASATRLCAQLELLSEAEQLTWRNIL